MANIVGVSAMETGVGLNRCKSDLPAMLISRRFLNLLVGTDVRYDLMCVDNCETRTDATSNKACTDAASYVFV